MKIDIERSGGIAGISKTITVDTNDLPRDMTRNIEKRLSEMKSSNRPKIMRKNRVADCYCYKISGHIGNKKQEIEFGEFDIDKEFRSIINSLFKY